MQEVALVPDQSAVEEFTPAGLHPTLHEGVHQRHPDTAGVDLQPGVGHQGFEDSGELRIPVPDQELGRAARVPVGQCSSPATVIASRVISPILRAVAASGRMTTDMTQRFPTSTGGTWH
ncbi:hypothetical protein ACFRU3_13875 [Streptomyces sp. NPDC056910]|uniref:hypothetical protein n=1 Tax=Streptomyces sp. NPDC056910 TaxID=3345964 RepID=UPI0036CB5FFA